MPAVLRRSHNDRSSEITVGILILAAFIFFWTEQLRADDASEQVQIADPYLDLHTGPGRGYPIFYIVERGEKVTILKRQTDWFKVRSEKGKTGWASREQMERTLTETGAAKSFRDVLYEDYLRRRFEGGFCAGQTTGERISDQDVILTGYLGYRFNENQTLTWYVSQISDKFFSGRFIYLGIMSEPFPDWYVSPTMSLGFGKAEIEPKATLINTPAIGTEMANVGVGAKMYFSRRFFVRLDYKIHRLFVDQSDRTDEYKELSLGVGFFF